MSRDELAAFALIGSFAAWGTLHVLLAASLARTPPRWRGVVALFVPPLAPYWAIKSGRRLFGGAWISTCAIWAVSRVFLAR